MRPNHFLRMGILVISVIFFCGCEGTIKRKEKAKSYPVPVVEAEWIQNGEPLDFEGKTWFPVDSAENLLDEEVYLLGEYRGVQFFAEKIDVRPYNRLYTKCGKNKFRIFEKR